MQKKNLMRYINFYSVKLFLLWTLQQKCFFHFSSSQKRAYFVYTFHMLMFKKTLLYLPLDIIELSALLPALMR